MRRPDTVTAPVNETGVTLSAFADEISPDLDVQLDTLESEGIHALELRGVWGKNALDLSDEELVLLTKGLKRRGVTVSALGSPIGKIKITDPFEPHLSRFRHALQTARSVGTRYLRLFSFYIPSEADPAAYREEVMRRMRVLVGAARGTGIMLLHENEKDIYGDTGARCLDLLQTVAAPHFRAVFDPANFVQCGVHPMSEAYPLLERHIEYIHVKDAVFADDSVKPAGQGDGQVRELLGRLRKNRFAGYLSLEPHLAVAGPFSGFSGPDLFRVAARALKEILAELDWRWS